MQDAKASKPASAEASPKPAKASKSLPSGIAQPRARCKATRKDGQPCRGMAIFDGFCIGHAAQSRAWRAKGGRNCSKQARLDALLPARLRPVVDLLEKALHEVYEGALGPKQASAMASLAGALVKVIEAGSFEERLRALEAKMEAKNGK